MTVVRVAFFTALFFSAGTRAAETSRPPPASKWDKFPPSVLATKPAPVNGAFLHITDIHPDEFYRPGASIESSCHRVDLHNASGLNRGNNSASAKPTTRANDTNLKHKSANLKHKSLHSAENHTSGDGAGWWGAPGTICDSPFSLANVTLAWAGWELQNKVDFIIWTGDNARHDSDRKLPRSAKEISGLNQYVADLFRKRFPASLPIIPSIGNNDVYPHNILPKGPNPTINQFMSVWYNFIPEDQLHVFQRGGYFVRDVVPNKLAAISLNTMYFYNSNTAVNGCKGKHCPGKSQLAWLEVTLRLLRKRQMKVVISGHISPAASNYYPRCLKRYTELVIMFKDVVSAQVFGHSNIDHFFLLKGDNNVAEVVEESDPDEMMVAITSKSYVDELIKSFKKLPKHAGQAEDTSMYSVVHVTPSVIPVYNPSLRVFKYYTDGKPRVASKKAGVVDHAAPHSSRFGEIVDYVQYFVDLPRLYRRQGAGNAAAFPGYEIEYVARDAYPLGDERRAHRKEPLHVLDWINLAKRIAWDAQVQARFMKYLTVSNPEAPL